MSDIAERVKKIVVEHLSVDEAQGDGDALPSSTISARTASIRSSW